MNKTQAVKALAAMGCELWHGSGRAPDGMGWDATIDTIGRTSIGGDCRGQVVYNYTATASEFWDEVVQEAKDSVAPFIQPCPHPVGECEFHDADVD